MMSRVCGEMTWNYRISLTAKLTHNTSSATNSRETIITELGMIFRWASETRNSDLLYRRGKRKRGRQTILFISSAACTITIIIIVLVMFSSSFSSPTRSISYAIVRLLLNQIHFSIIFFIILFITFLLCSSFFTSMWVFFCLFWSFLPSSSTPSMDFMYRTSATYMKWKAALNDADGEKRRHRCFPDHNAFASYNCREWSTLKHSRKYYFVHARGAIKKFLSDFNSIKHVRISHINHTTLSVSFSSDETHYAGCCCSVCERGKCSSFNFETNSLSLHSKSRDLIPFGSFPSRTEENADKTTGDGVKEENEIILSVKALLLFLLWFYFFLHPSSCSIPVCCWAHGVWEMRKEKQKEHNNGVARTKKRDTVEINGIELNSSSSRALLFVLAFLSLLLIASHSPPLSVLFEKQFPPRGERERERSSCRLNQFESLVKTQLSEKNHSKQLLRLYLSAGLRA